MKRKDEYDIIIKTACRKYGVSSKIVKGLLDNFFKRFPIVLSRYPEVHIEGLGKFRVRKIVKVVHPKREHKQKYKLSNEEYRNLVDLQYKETMFASGVFAQIQRKRRLEATERQIGFLSSFGSKPLLLNNGVGKKVYYLAPHCRGKDYCIEKEFYTENKLS